MRKMKNISIIVHILSNLYCNFIKGVKVFIIIMSFLINYHQKIVYYNI